MKRIMMLLLLTVAAVGVSLAQEVQPQTTPEKPQLTEEQKAKMQQRKEILDLRLQIIKEELKLTDEQFEKFTPVYLNYDKAIHFGNTKPTRLDWENATKKDINEFLKAQLDNTINKAMVRKSYILLFEDVITPKQLCKLYKIEDKLVTRARQEYKSRQNK
ncbi:MAG: hypothetical protein J6R13_03135 [Alistipes sp.]|nr:hypothetical protein [Alistipes sp.]